MTITAAPYLLSSLAFALNSASPSLSEMELMTGLPGTHFRPASRMDHLDESIMIGTRAMSGSLATRFKKRAMAASHHRPVLLICRSGNRSKEAGEPLKRNGFTDVYNVLHGFEGELDEHHRRSTRNGWRHDGLPWEQC